MVVDAAASIAGLLGVGIEIIRQLIALKEVPEAFLDVRIQLPVLRDSFKNIQNWIRDVASEIADLLQPVIDRCVELLKQLKGILGRTTPPAKSLSWKNVVQAVKCLKQVKAMKEISNKLDGHIRTLQFYHGATNFAIRGTQRTQRHSTRDTCISSPGPIDRNDNSGASLKRRNTR